MPNPYFRFKKFDVYQDQCAMKICTDSCLFGAWAAHWLIKNNKTADEVLDIGAGTGLLSLMLAQQLCKANISAVETDHSSARQAKENMMQSPWADRLHVYHNSIQNFFPETEYDFIISNPPFYENDLISENKAKNIAHHNAGLTLLELVMAVKRLLATKGIFAVLLPYHRTNEFEKIAGNAGFFLIQKTLVRQTNLHSYFRSMCIFSTEQKSCQPDEIVIKNGLATYTSEFIDLMKDYYLYL